MAKKLNYDPKTILNITFSPSNAGYDDDEVDLVFDKMIEDYNSFIDTINELKKQNEQSVEKYEKLKEEFERTKFELASIKKQFAILKKTSGVSDDNIRLVQKITAYERVLYRKGIDLKKALSDPDNC